MLTRTNPNRQTETLLARSSGASENVAKLSVPNRQAIRHARSRKGYWRMAKTIASGVGLTNAWLAAQDPLPVSTLLKTLP